MRAVQGYVFSTTNDTVAVMTFTATERPDGDIELVRTIDGAPTEITRIAPDHPHYPYLADQLASLAGVGSPPEAATGQTP